MINDFCDYCRRPMGYEPGQPAVCPSGGRESDRAPAAPVMSPPPHPPPPAKKPRRRLPVKAKACLLLLASSLGAQMGPLRIQEWLGQAGRAAAAAEIAAGHPWVGFVTDGGPGTATTPYTLYLSPTPMVLSLIVPTTTGTVAIAVSEISPH